MIFSLLEGDLGASKGEVEAGAPERGERDCPSLRASEEEAGITIRTRKYCMLQWT